MVAKQTPKTKSEPECRPPRKRRGPETYCGEETDGCAAGPGLQKNLLLPTVAPADVTSRDASQLQPLQLIGGFKKPRHEARKLRPRGAKRPTKGVGDKTSKAGRRAANTETRSSFSGLRIHGQNLDAEQLNIWSGYAENESTSQEPYSLRPPASVRKHELKES